MTVVKLLPVRGLRTPRLFLWMRGRTHDKMHTGGLDAETKRITSGYITGQTRRFASAVEVRRCQLEQQFTPLLAEADKLLLRLSFLDAALAAGSVRPDPDASNAQRRVNDADRARRAQLAGERQTILQRLSDIRNSVEAAVKTADRQTAATAEALLSSFCAYGHGLLLHPLVEANLPAVDVTPFWEELSKSKTWQALNQALCRAKED